MKEECGNCRFYKDDGPAHFKEGYGACLRHPDHVRTNDGKWCGEYKLAKRPYGIPATDTPGGTMPNPLPHLTKQITGAQAHALLAFLECYDLYGPTWAEVEKGMREEYEIEQPAEALRDARKALAS